MLIALIGESCTGKSTLAALLADKLSAKVYTGNDYLRMAGSEGAAAACFRKLLAETAESTDTHALYVISEKEQLNLLPETCFRVLMTADLETIKTRFAARMHGVLPPPVAAMLAKKHGMFDDTACDVHLANGMQDAADNAATVLARIGWAE